MPGVEQLASIANTPLNYNSAIEFYNFIQIALDGVKFCRLNRELLKKGQPRPSIDFPTQVVDDWNKTVCYVKLKKIYVNSIL